MQGVRATSGSAVARFSEIQLRFRANIAFDSAQVWGPGGIDRLCFCSIRLGLVGWIAGASDDRRWCGSELQDNVWRRSQRRQLLFNQGPGCDSLSQVSRFTTFCPPSSIHGKTDRIILLPSISFSIAPRQHLDDILGHIEYRQARHCPWPTTLGSYIVHLRGACERSRKSGVSEHART